MTEELVLTWVARPGRRHPRRSCSAILAASLPALVEILPASAAGVTSRRGVARAAGRA